MDKTQAISHAYQYGIQIPSHIDFAISLIDFDDECTFQAAVFRLCLRISTRAIIIAALGQLDPKFFHSPKLVPILLQVSTLKGLSTLQSERGGNRYYLGTVGSVSNAACRRCGVSCKYYKGGYLKDVQY